MTREEVTKKVNEIFCDIFDDEDIVITDATTAEDIEDWDSLEQINLLVAMEKEFGIKIPLADVANLENVGAMIDLVIKLMA